MVSFVALIFPKPPLCALKTNFNVFPMKCSLNWFPHFVHMYILTLNFPKFHSLSGCCLCAAQFGHFGMTNHFSRDMGKIAIYRYYDVSSVASKCCLVSFHSARSNALKHYITIYATVTAAFSSWIGFVSTSYVLAFQYSFASLYPFSFLAASFLALHSWHRHAPLRCTYRV